MEPREIVGEVELFLFTTGNTDHRGHRERGEKIHRRDAEGAERIQEEG